GEASGRSALAKPRWPLQLMPLEERLRVLVVERMQAGEHLVKQHTERIQIGPMGDGVHSVCGLGRHVPDRAEHRTLRRDRDRFGDRRREALQRNLGEPEVEDLHDIRRSFYDHDVSRLEIAMEDVESVDRLETERYS